MRIFLQRSGSTVPQASRHPEVDQENTTRFEPNNQILAATVDRLDAFVDQFGGDELRRERSNESGIADSRSRDSSALEHGRDPRTNGLYLGQFGHPPSVATPVLVTGYTCGG